MRNLKGLVALFVITALATLPVHAAYYDLGKNGANKININWVVEAPLETIHGVTNQVSGYAYVDEESGNHKVSISIPVKSMKTGITMRDEHMLGKKWMNEKKFPLITFESTKIVQIKGETDTFDISGVLTIHGVSRNVKLKGTSIKIPAKKSLEKMGYVGDMIHLKIDIPIELSDYGIIVPGGLLGVKMSNRLDIDFNVFGFTNHKPNRQPPTPASRPASKPASRPSR